MLRRLSLLLYLLMLHDDPPHPSWFSSLHLHKNKCVHPLELLYVCFAAQHNSEQNECDFDGDASLFFRLLHNHWDVNVDQLPAELTWLECRVENEENQRTGCACFAMWAAWFQSLMKLRIGVIFFHLIFFVCFLWRLNWVFYLSINRSNINNI